MLVIYNCRYMYQSKITYTGIGRISVTLRHGSYSQQYRGEGHRLNYNENAKRQIKNQILFHHLTVHLSEQPREIY
jgi:hypothetical protein